MPVLRNPVQFNPTKWHGTTPWKGSRTALSFYVIRKGHLLSAEEQRRLRELQFPAFAAAAAAASHDAPPPKAPKRSNVERS